MNADELTLRLRRIYAAIAASQESDVSKFPATVVAGKDFIGVFQDFTGGLREEAISNIAHQAIHNIANLRDNLSKWAEANGKDPQKVWDTFNSSLDCRIVQDLSNNDKHGYPPKNGHGNTGVAPRLTEVNRVMRLKTQPRAGSFVMLAVGADGKSLVRGDGSASVVVTGQVADRDGKVLGDLYEIELRAVQEWESLLAEYGVTLPAAA